MSECKKEGCSEERNFLSHFCNKHTNEFNNYQAPVDEITDLKDKIKELEEETPTATELEIVETLNRKNEEITRLRSALDRVTAMTFEREGSRYEIIHEIAQQALKTEPKKKEEKQVCRTCKGPFIDGVICGAMHCIDCHRKECGLPPLKTEQEK